MKNSGLIYRQIFGVVAVVGLSGLSACKPTAEQSDALNDSLSGEAAPASTAVPATSILGKECFQENFKQPTATVQRSIDLLFVADTSGSLIEERTRIAEGIDAFFGALPADTDIRVGVLLAHGKRSRYYGKLYQKGTEPVVLRSDRSNLQQVREDLKLKLSRPAGDYYTDGGEAMLSASMAILDTDRLRDAKDQGLFRSDAALAVLYITDENDICADLPTGYQKVPDPDGLESRAKAAECTVTWNGSNVSVTPNSVLTALQTVRTGATFLIGAIAYNQQNYPKEGENEYAFGITDLVSLSRGVSIDLMDGKFSEGLSQVATLASVHSTLNSQFTLAQASIDKTTVQVFVDGLPVAFTYIDTTRTVQPSALGVADSTITVNYCRPGSTNQSPIGI